MILSEHYRSVLCISYSAHDCVLKNIKMFNNQDLWPALMGLYLSWQPVGVFLLFV